MSFESAFLNVPAACIRCSSNAAVDETNLSSKPVYCCCPKGWKLFHISLLKYLKDNYTIITYSRTPLERTNFCFPEGVRIYPSSIVHTTSRVEARKWSLPRPSL